MVGGDELGLSLAEELQRLGPFGRDNPPVALLLPAATVHDPRPMGEGRHVRFSVRSGGARSQAVAFGNGGRLPVGEDAPADAVFALEVNRFRGAVEPRLVLRHAQPCGPTDIVRLGELDSYLDGVWRELAADPPDEGEGPPPQGGVRAVCDRRGRGLAGRLAGLVASGEPVLVVCADAARRHGHLRDRLGGFALCDYRALERDPALARAYAHLALLDPPAWRRADAVARAGEPDQYVHLCWGPSEVEFARRALARDYDLRAALVDCYRALRAAGECEGDALGTLLAGSGRPPALAGRLLRVLTELSLVCVDAQAASARAVSDVSRTELERAATFRAAQRRLAEGQIRLGEPACAPAPVAALAGVAGQSAPRPAA